MKEKIIQILKQYDIPTHLHGTIVFVIDKLNEEEIDKLKEIIQAQDVLNKVYAFTDIIEPPGEDNIMKLKKKIAELKQEAGL